MEIGLKIAQYLKDNGIKQRFLSEKTGIPESVISDICLGNRKRIDAVELFKICKALNVDMMTFMPDEVAL